MSFALFISYDLIYLTVRFDCKFRTYRYFFPRGCMDIDMMKEGSKHLEGIHDFRNLCKMDVANGVVSFMREIKSAEIHLASKSLIDPSYDMLYLELVGSAYLWHQVRCIMAILMLVGQKLESPDVVAELLDVEKTPWYVKLLNFNRNSTIENSSLTAHPNTVWLVMLH